MNLKIGIVGLPNVGKSTLFNAITKKSVPAENFPFCTIDPSVGVVPVPDARMDKLAEMSQTEKTVPAIVEFVDIAGLVAGASEGAGLGNKFLQHIREVDAIAQVVRVFEDADITHVSGNVDPARDINIINLELVLADLETATKRRGNIERDAKSGKKEAIAEKAILEKVIQMLEAGKLARSAGLSPEEVFVIKSLNLLTLKPMMYVLNSKASGHNVDDHTDERARALTHFLEEAGAGVVRLDAGVEQELKDIAHDDAQEFRREFNVFESGVDALIRAGYQLLNLMSFYTTGKKETRAWTIVRGSTAPEAGAAIHNDFKDKFIRADVIAWDKLIEAGSWANAREKGLVRTEGKEYIVQEGEVMEFKHS